MRQNWYHILIENTVRTSKFSKPISERPIECDVSQEDEDFLTNYVTFTRSNKRNFGIMPTRLLADVRKRLRSFSTKTTKNDPDNPNSKLQLSKNC